MVHRTLPPLFIALIVFILLIGQFSVADASGHPQETGPGLTAVVTETGTISWSIDGIGTTGTGALQVDKPAGATVRKAYAAASSSPGQLMTNTSFLLNGSPIIWDASKTVFSGVINMTNFWADVTSIVKPVVDAADAGILDISAWDANYDNEALALIVIFDDPNQTVQNTVILMFGGQNPAGDTASMILANPINTSAAGFALDMSVGIAFGYQPGGQYSIIRVNDTLLTSAAGGFDDAAEAANNGNLATVGGVGDSNANPADPALTSASGGTDDELYNLIPFVQNGDTTLTTFTQNPSVDDNIFFIGYFVGANTALVDGGTLPALLSVSPDSGPITGGTPVTINGVNLAGVTSVSFGDTPVSIGSCSISANQVTCPTPAHDAAVVDVSVTTPAGTATLSSAFTYDEEGEGEPDDETEEEPETLPLTGFPVGGVTTLPVQPSEKLYSSSGMTLVIHDLSLRTEIVGVPLADQQWDVSWLGDSAGYLEGSAYPTWAGNTVLTGHVWDADNTAGIFADLKKLNYGDRIYILAFDHTYTYEVRENSLVRQSDVDSVFRPEELDWVTLLTCEGYSITSGDYTNRRVVKAVLVRVD